MQQLIDQLRTPPSNAAFLRRSALSLARQTFTWWPIHPLGYALACTNSMEYMWCPFFLAWVAKLITLRYGGIRAYRAAWKEAGHARTPSSLNRGRR